MPDVRQQVITGVVSPETDEARIRDAWPSVQRAPGMAGLGRALTRTIVLAPLAWMLMALGYFAKVMPFAARRYVLTNRRMKILGGWKAKVREEVALKDIDDVRVVTDGNSNFFRAATLEIISKGQIAMRLYGVPEPDGFRHAILNACNAWVKDRNRGPFIPASAKSD